MPPGILTDTAKLTVMIPPNAAGTDYLYVEDGGQRLKSPAAFQVIAPPVFGGFAPASGPTGSQVTINGQNLGGAARVWFGALECQVVKRVGATQIVVTVPAAAKGKDFFTVEDGAQRVRAAQAFEVTVPAAPPPAGHAEHEHAHEHPHEVGDHHHHPHAHPHRPGTNHHHPY